MFGVAQRSGRGLVLLSVAAAFALSGCGNGSPTAAPSATATGTPVAAPTATPVPTTNSATALTGAAAALANLTSYQFKMLQAGTDSVNQLSDLTSGASTASPDGAVSFTGTILTKPDKAADVTTSGLHVIFVGGSDYMDVGNTGAFGKVPADTSSISDPFTPAQMFAKIRLTGYVLDSSESKDGVDCAHYKAGASALAELGSVSGIKGATWTADIWLASDGGYPVSVAIIATAKDGSVPYETTFDLSKINDSANKVVAPDNVLGA